MIEGIAVILEKDLETVLRWAAGCYGLKPGDLADYVIFHQAGGLEHLSNRQRKTLGRVKRRIEN